jgi:hypothetical protein
MIKSGENNSNESGSPSRFQNRKPTFTNMYLTLQLPTRILLAQWPFATGPYIGIALQDILLVYKLTEIAKNYNFKISTNKAKTVAFRGRFPIGTKIVIDNERIEQASHFTYLG